MRNNIAWINREKRIGSEIIDIGPDWLRRAERGGDPSDFYQAEVERAIDYPGYTWDPQP